MDLAKINETIQKYDKKLKAVFVEGYLETTGGFRYKDKGVRIQWEQENGKIHDIADYFENEAKPDRILRDLQRMDTRKGADTYKQTKQKNKDWEHKLDEDGKEVMNEINTEIADYMVRKPVSFNLSK